jgi:hypothetical protein
MPSCGHLTIHSSPPVMLMHLAADLIPLGLWVTRQEVPRKLVCLGNSLVVSLLGFFEHLLGVKEHQLAGLLVFLGTQTLGPYWLLEIIWVLASLSTALASFCTAHQVPMVDET